MGLRVHVIKQSTKYGSEGFNWQAQDFKDFLDAMGCCTNGEEYASQFDCQSDLYKKAMDILKEYKKNGNSKKVEDFLNNEEIDYTLENFESDIKCLGGIDEVLGTMQSFYDTREKDNDYICFEVW